MPRPAVIPIGGHEDAESDPRAPPLLELGPKHDRIARIEDPLPQRVCLAGLCNGREPAHDLTLVLTPSPPGLHLRRARQTSSQGHWFAHSELTNL